MPSTGYLAEGVNTCTWKFTAGLFTIAKMWKPLQNLLTDEKIGNKIPRMNYLSCAIAQS